MVIVIRPMWTNGILQAMVVPQGMPHEVGGSGCNGPCHTCARQGVCLVRTNWKPVKMGVISAYIVNKAGGLIFSHDQPTNSAEVEVTFNYPLSIVLEEVDRYLVVKYGEKLGIQG